MNAIAELEARIRRLERLAAALGVLCLVGFATALWTGTAGRAEAQPAAADAKFKTVEAAEVLAPNAHIDTLTVAKGLMIQKVPGAAGGKTGASIVLDAKGEPGLVLQTADDQLMLSPDGLLIRSLKTDAAFGVTKSGNSYRLLVTDKDGKLVREWPPVQK